MKKCLQIAKSLISLWSENNLCVADRDIIETYNLLNEYIGTATTYRKLRGIVFLRSMASINKELKDLLERFEIDKKVGIDSSMLVRFLLSSINSMENLRDSIIEKKEKDNDSNNDEEFVEQMYKLYPSKCPKRQTSLGKTQKDKDRIRKLLKKYPKDDIERVIRNEIDTKYGIAYMQNFSTFLNNFPDPTQIDSYNEFKGISTKPLPKGWEQERYDMYIRNGYTITDDGRLFKDGREIK